MSKLEYDTKLEKPADYPGDAAFVVVPFDVKAEFGKANPKVKAYFDGYLYRGSISTILGPGEYCILARQDVRQSINKQPGDTVHMVVELDNEPRIVEVPADFAAALAEITGARAAFDNMAYTHRREYVEAINDAKKPETRAKRIAQAVEMISQNKLN